MSVLFSPHEKQFPARQDIFQYCWHWEGPWDSVPVSGEWAEWFLSCQTPRSRLPEGWILRLSLPLDSQCFLNLVPTCFREESSYCCLGLMKWKVNFHYVKPQRIWALFVSAASITLLIKGYKLESSPCPRAMMVKPQNLTQQTMGV